MLISVRVRVVDEEVVKVVLAMEGIEITKPTAAVITTHDLQQHRNTNKKLLIEGTLLMCPLRNSSVAPMSEYFPLY